MSEVANAKFSPGDKVRISNANPPGHRRVPSYVRGHVGTIERICGAFPNPEELAYGFDGLPKRPLYRVRIRQTDIAIRTCSNSRSTSIGSKRLEENTMANVETRDRSHHHDEHHDHTHGHSHSRDPIEVTEGAGEYEIMVHAIKELLIEKGVITSADIRKTLEFVDTRTPALGAKVVARAWTDAEFKRRLLANCTAAVAEMGIPMGDAELIVVENTKEVHNVIVCTLCSCYPRTVLGLPPDWYKSRNYRSRVVAEPRAVLKEFGTEVPQSVMLRTHDSNADMRYLVLPERPAGTEGWSEEQLAAIVTRDCMIGVAVPQAN